MKHQWIAGPHSVSTGIALLLLVVACGGKQTVASKSAEAFREAQKKGVATGSQPHGGHAAAGGEEGAAPGSTGDHATMTGMDHSTMATGTGAMIGMDHGNTRGTQSGQSMAGMDHSSMPGMKQGTTARGQQQSMAGMDHGNMPGMKQGTTARGQQQSMAGMDHSNMPGMQQSTTKQGQHPMAGMDHGNMPGMQQGSTSRATLNPPTTNAEMQRLRPASTLKGDAFDAPAAAAISEAMKASRGGSHEGMEMRGITPGQDKENPPTPAPAFRDGPAQGVTAAPAMDHSSHGQTAPVASTVRENAPSPGVDHSQHAQPARTTQPKRTATPRAAPAAATVYTCPMHPEVTSAKPGTCPKCGMALVKKK